MLPERTGPGRRREFCTASCRQLDYQSRRRSAEAGLGDDDVIVSRRQLDDLHDRLYALEAAVEDAEHDRAAARTVADHRQVVDDLLAAARPVARTRLLSDT